MENGSHVTPALAKNSHARLRISQREPRQPRLLAAAVKVKKMKNEGTYYRRGARLRL